MECGDTVDGMAADSARCAIRTRLSPSSPISDIRATRASSPENARVPYRETPVDLVYNFQMARQQRAEHWQWQVSSASGNSVGGVPERGHSDGPGASQSRRRSSPGDASVRHADGRMVSLSCTAKCRANSPPIASKSRMCSMSCSEQETKKNCCASRSCLRLRLVVRIEHLGDGSEINLSATAW